MENTNKLPFKAYTVMNNVLINKLGCSDVYRAFVLSLTADKTNNTTDTTLDQLAAFIGEKVSVYKRNSKTLSFSETLKETGVVNVISYRGTSIKGGRSVKRNTYTFLKGSEFRMIGREFFHLDLDIKVKGYLIKLFSICNTNTLVLGKSPNEIYKEVAVTKATQKKYNEILIAKGLIKETPEGLLLNVPGFNNIEKKVEATEYTKSIIKLHKRVIESHANTYNKIAGGPIITKIDRAALDLLKEFGMSNKSYQVGIYMINGFKGVTDINKLIKKIESTPAANTEEFKRVTMDIEL